MAVATFTVLPTMEGYEVIDSHTGRPVDSRPEKPSAVGVAFRLNEAAKKGPQSLARALKAG